MECVPSITPHRTSTPEARAGPFLSPDDFSEPIGDVGSKNKSKGRYKMSVMMKRFSPVITFKTPPEFNNDEQGWRTPPLPSGAWSAETHNFNLFQSRGREPVCRLLRRHCLAYRDGASWKG